MICDSEFFEATENAMEGVQRALNDAAEWLDYIDKAGKKRGRDILNACENARREMRNAAFNADRMYAEAEQARAGADARRAAFADGWSEILDALPDPRCVSARDVCELLEMIQAWRESR